MGSTRALKKAEHSPPFYVYLTPSNKLHNEIPPRIKRMKVKHSWIVLAACASLLFGSINNRLHAQEAFGGLPPTFTESVSELRSSEAPHVIKVTPDFNIADLRAVNDWKGDEAHLKPLRIGRVIDTSIDFAKEAKKSVLEYGKEVYRLAISAPGARSLTLTYSDFFIPNDGSCLYIYNTNRSALLGAYKYETHPKHGVFANEPLIGDELILEYVPGTTDAKPSILISGVGYITYPNIGIGAQNKKQFFFDPGEDNSDPTCQANMGINCPVGANWQTEKTGIIQIVMYEEGYLGCCSGNLLNNTNEDFKPYIISAAHCITGDDDKPTTIQADLDKWTFRFHYEKPTCSTGSIALNRGKSVIGCTVKSYMPITVDEKTAKSDGMLLLANSEIPKNFRVFYNGWDRRTPRPYGEVVGIHHPSGDAKKICLADQIEGLGTWDTPGSVGGKSAHIRVVFTRGSVEGGSSGSSLFDKNHRVIATLTGGRNGCDAVNYYGRLNYHWNRYKNKSNPYSYMDEYLDPKEGGKTERLDGVWREGLKPLAPATQLTISLQDNDQIKVTWKGIDRSTIPAEWKVQYRLFRNGELIKEFGADDELSYVESRAAALGDPNREGGVVYGVRVRYDFAGNNLPDDGYNKGQEYAYDDSDIAECGFYLGKLIESVPVKVDASGSNGAFLTWNEPAYIQEVSLFGYPKNMELGTYTRPHLELKGRWESGSRYNLAVHMASYVFTKDRNACIYAVKLVPDTKASGKYSLYIRNGVKFDGEIGQTVGYVYEQPFDVPDNWNPGEWVTVLLDKPFVFDSKEALYVGYSTANNEAPVGLAYVKNSENDVRRYCDAFLMLTSMQHPVPQDYPKTSKPPKAYHAIRVAFASSPNVEKKVDYESFAKGVTPVPFPKVEGYTIKKNGQVIASNVKGTSYSDAKGTASDNYEVVISYKKELATEGAFSALPEVYPTQLRANAVLNIRNHQSVARLTVYNLDGAVLMQVDSPEATVDLSQLPQGVFMVVLDVDNQRITQKITK